MQTRQIQNPSSIAEGEWTFSWGGWETSIKGEMIGTWTALHPSGLTYLCSTGYGAGAQEEALAGLIQKIQEDSADSPSADQAR